MDAKQVVFVVAGFLLILAGVIFAETVVAIALIPVGVGLMALGGVKI